MQRQSLTIKLLPLLPDSHRNMLLLCCPLAGLKPHQPTKHAASSPQSMAAHLPGCLDPEQNLLHPQGISFPAAACWNHIFRHFQLWPSTLAELWL